MPAPYGRTRPGTTQAEPPGSAWRFWLGGWVSEEIRTETPELTADEAEHRATRTTAEAWAKNANTDRRNDLRARIGELCREHGLKADYFEGTDRWGVLGDDNQARLRPVDDEDLPAWQRAELDGAA